MRKTRNFSMIFKTMTSRLTLLKRKIAAHLHFIHAMKDFKDLNYISSLSLGKFSDLKL